MPAIIDSAPSRYSRTLATFRNSSPGSISGNATFLTCSLRRKTRPHASAPFHLTGRLLQFYRPPKVNIVFKMDVLM